LVAEIERELGTLEALFPREAIAPMLDLAGRAGNNLRDGAIEHPLSTLSRETKLPRPSVDGLPYWLSIAEWLLTKDGTFREKVDKRQGFLAPSRAVASELGHRLDEKQAMGALLARLEQVPGLVAALHAV